MSTAAIWFALLGPLVGLIGLVTAAQVQHSRWLAEHRRSLAGSGRI